MLDMSTADPQLFVGYGIQLELKDGKIIQGKINKITQKGLTLNDVKFNDGGRSNVFKIRASRLKDLKVLSLPSKKQQQQQQQQQQPRGDWMDDDVTKIKNQQDFDFQSNLNMFDKKQIFDQLKQNDNIESSKRLVSHNVNKQDFDNDEYILSKHDEWNKISSEQDDDNEVDDDDEDGDYDDDDDEYLPITKSINITHLLNSSATNDESLSKLQQLIINETNSSHPFIKNPKTDQMVPMITPIEILEIERITNDSFQIMTLNEIFAMNLSYLIKYKFFGGRKRLNSQNNNPEPLILITISEFNRSGFRAITLARFLSQLNQIRVILLFPNYKKTTTVNKEFNLQFEIFKKCGGKVINSIKNLNAILSKLNSPIELIIDAIQGFDFNLNDLDDANQYKIIEVINWINSKNKHTAAKIWSFDLPSGHDSSTGYKNFEEAITKIDKIVCTYSWPLTCTNILKPAITSDKDNVILIDCGIPKNVYLEKNSLRKFYNVDTFVESGAIELTI